MKRDGHGGGAACCRMSNLPPKVIPESALNARSSALDVAHFYRFYDIKSSNMNWPNKRRATVAASPLRAGLASSSKSTGGSAASANSSLAALGDDLSRSRLLSPSSQALRFVRPDKESLRKLILRCLLNVLWVCGAIECAELRFQVLLSINTWLRSRNVL